MFMSLIYNIFLTIMANIVVLHRLVSSYSGCHSISPCKGVVYLLVSAVSPVGLTSCLVYAHSFSSLFHFCQISISQFISYLSLLYYV